jgi:hypothetical protein
LGVTAVIVPGVAQELDYAVAEEVENFGPEDPVFVRWAVAGFEENGEEASTQVSG